MAVLLPRSYKKDSSRYYPVLYMHDGQNCFDPSTSFVGVDWQVDEVVDTLTQQGKLQEILVVFVSNTDDRVEEYSDSPKGRAYVDFLVHEVKPFIDQTYRTLPDRENTAVMGSSLGGLVSFLCFLYYPDIFSKAGCLSISLWSHVNDRYAELLGGLNEKYKDCKVYFDTGNEMLDDGYRKEFDRLKGLVLSNGFVEHKNAKFCVYENHDHSERSWAKRVHVPLSFLFGVEEE